MKRLTLALGLILLTGCARSNVTLTWDSSTSDCTGAQISGVKYNVYWLSGSGPVPEVPQVSAAASPCGPVRLVDTTKVRKANTSPLSATSFRLALPDGIYTVIIEGVSSNGIRGSYISSTFSVVELRATASNLTPTKD
jgi:hypothetical protein